MLARLKPEANAQTAKVWGTHDESDRVLCGRGSSNITDRTSRSLNLDSCFRRNDSEALSQFRRCVAINKIHSDPFIPCRCQNLTNTPG